MQSLQSTERHINILCLGKSMRSFAKLNRRAVTSTKAGEYVLKQSAIGKRPYSSVSSKLFNFNRRIKLYTGVQKTKNLSTVSPLEVPLLNPDKPSPVAIAELAPQPIVPLSQSRFPKSNLEVPSVTKILQATMPAASRFVLDKWRESMIKKLGVAGFNTYQNDTFERGRALHALLAEYLMGHGEPTEGKAELSKDIVVNLWKSIQSVVKDKISNVRLVEHIVSHPSMKYRGIVDCVAFYEGELVVIDFKTAEKPKKDVKSLYDNPLQVTAYCGAINCDPNIPAHVIDRNISAGVVIVAYVDGSDASVYHLDNEQTNAYWKQWVARLDQFSRMEEMSQENNSKVLKKVK